MCKIETFNRKEKLMNGIKFTVACLLVPPVLFLHGLGMIFSEVGNLLMRVMGKCSNKVANQSSDLALDMVGTIHDLFDLLR